MLFSLLHFSLVRLRLRDGFREHLLEVVAAEGVLAVVGDEAIEAVEGQVVDQEVLLLAPLLLGLDPAVIHSSLPPVMMEQKIFVIAENIFLNTIVISDL